MSYDDALGQDCRDLPFTNRAESDTIPLLCSAGNTSRPWNTSVDSGRAGSWSKRSRAMKSWSVLAAIMVVLAWWAGVESARGQTLERDMTITGPRGRSVERQVEVQRRPGSIDRQVTIKRPGGTFERQVQLQRSPVARVARGPVGPWPRGPWLPRPVVVGPAVPAFGLGLLAAPSFNFAFGGGGVAPIPPGPAVMAPGVPAAGVPPPPDHVAVESQRLQSFYPSARKEAAYALGRLGDPRAVPGLINALKHDLFHDVRVAAALALGEIGGSE